MIYLDFCKTSDLSEHIKIALLNISETQTQEELGWQIKEELQVGNHYCLNVLNSSAGVSVGPMLCIFLKNINNLEI